MSELKRKRACVHIEIKEGRSLAAKDRNGTSDPYTVIGLVNQNGELEKKKWRSFKSPFLKKTLNPVWNYSCSVYPEEGGQLRTVRVEVWDKDLLGSDFMGMADLKFDEQLTDGKTFDQWVTLQARPNKKKDKVSGEIHIIATFKSANTREEEMEDLKEAFSLFDADGDGTITSKELISILQRTGSTISEKDVQNMMNIVDTDKSGKIDFPEFANLMQLTMGDKNPDDELWDAFKKFDTDNNGFIDKEELKHLFKKLGQALDDDQLNEMFAVADENGDGQINFEEFQSMMS